MARTKKIAGFLLMLTLLTGCWDRIEIEDRGFVIGAAIDMPKKEEAEEKTEKEKEGDNRPKGKARFVVTYQFVIPGKLQGGGGSGGSGGGNGDAFKNITSEGETLFEITRGMATRTSRSPFFPHIQLIVVSEEVARSKHFANVLDFFLRDHEMRRGTQVMISKGEAKKVLEVKPQVEKLPVIYIQSVAQNSHKTARMVAPSRIGDIHEQLLAANSYVIQRIVASKEEVKIAGSAVFHGHDNVLVGWLGEEETEGLNFLKGEIKGGLLKVGVEDNLISYEIKGVKRKIKVDTRDKDNLTFTITMATEGNIPEALETESWSDDKVIKNVEKKVGEEIERITKDTIQKLQGEFKTDAIGLGRYLSKEYPDLWETIRNDWDRGENYFAKSTINVEGKAIIRNAGVIIKSEPIQD
jgi:spore germination protein